MPLIPLLLGWGKSALSFFSRPPGSWIACALAVIAGIWWYGHHQYNEGFIAAQEEAENAARPIIVKQGDISREVVTKYVAVKADTQAKIITRIKEVPVHVTEKADAACPVPLGFVRVFNDAAHGPVPGASEGTDDTPSGVALSEVAQASVENSGEYDKLADQLKALQDWVRQQHAANP